MSILSSFVIRATGIPDKKYLRDPVIKRCYKRLSRRVPALVNRDKGASETADHCLVNVRNKYWEMYPSEDK